MTPKKPTITDVARTAGVSKSTVSAVLNRRAAVTDATRQDVQRAMAALGYRPSPSARRGFRPMAGKMIGFVVKESANPYYADVLGGIEEAAGPRGYMVAMVSSGGDYQRERQVIEDFTEREFDGLIITPIRNDDSDLSHIFELKRNGMPFVLLERVSYLNADLVDVDNVMASAQAVRYLIERGHGRIVHFAGPAYSEHTRERSEGVRRAFSESHLACDDSMFIPAGDSLEAGYAAALSYFGGAGLQHATAVTCYNDLVAVGVLKALRELSIDVPGRVSVIGFDGLSLLDFLPNGLSTVRMPRREMGQRAAELLIRRIEASEDLPPEKVTLETELLIRESTSA